MSSTAPPQHSLLHKDNFQPSRSELKELNQFMRPETKDLVAELLYHNHETHHCFFNTKSLHNHAIHQMVAGLTVGATRDQIQRHYDHQLKHVLDSFSLSDRNVYDPYLQESQDNRNVIKITSENWMEYTGNAKYYWSYLHFFESEIASNGIAASLERFVFDTEANKPGTQMLNRFFGGVLHAMIHCGYGAELSMPGLVAEGLAMATSTSLAHQWLFSQDWLRGPPPAGAKDVQNRRLLPIIADMLQDDRLSYQSLKLQDASAGLVDEPFQHGGSAYGLIHQYADQWQAVQSSDAVQGDMAMHDLSLLSALLLGAVPKRQGAYHHDFFLMHLNNAHLFTPIYLSMLAPKNQVVFLRALLAQFLYYWVSRGRPSFSATHWVEEDKVAKDLDWPSMFSAATNNIDEHCVKAVRSLYVFSARFKGDSLREMADAHLIDSAELDQITKIEPANPFLLTARQIVRMHQGMIRPSQHTGDLIGSDTEFWDFDKFAPER